MESENNFKIIVPQKIIISSTKVIKDIKRTNKDETVENHLSLMIDRLNFSWLLFGDKQKPIPNYDLLVSIRATDRDKDSSLKGTLASKNPLVIISDEAEERWQKLENFDQQKLVKKFLFFVYPISSSQNNSFRYKQQFQKLF